MEINNKLIDKTEDIDDLLVLHQVNATIKKEATDRDERIKNKIKIYLKERKWKRYENSKTKVSVTISKQKRQKVDMEQLNFMLTESQLSQVMSTIVFEKMMILSKKDRERLSRYVRKKK